MLYVIMQKLNYVPSQKFCLPIPRKGTMPPFKVHMIIFLRILDNVTIFSENWNTAHTGLLLTSNMFALSSEMRVKNGYHIYILNWKLGNSREKKRILPQRAQYLWGGGIQVINCICQLSLGYAVVTSNSPSLCFLKQ